jgi:site-specific DNA recombinase
MRAAIYVRVSTERQERQQTIASQLAPLRAWARSADHTLSEDHVFRDEGYSGARLDRPGLDALRDAVRDREVDIVGVLTPDRLARKYAYQVLLLEEFRRAGCAVAFVNHAISDDPGDQLLLQIQGAVAEYERALLAERFRRGKQQKARAGQFIGAKAPYGYRYRPRQDGAAGRLEIDPAEAEVVRMLYDWLVSEGLTLRQILKRLNFGPWFPRCGRRPWSPSTVHHILADPVYTGTAYVNRYEYRIAKKPRSRKPSYSGKGCRQLRPREQWIAVPVPALIDPDLWERAQAQLQRNSTLSFRNNARHNYLLRCLLTCGCCGLAMYGITRSRDAAGRRRRSYRCRGRDCTLTAREAPCPRAEVNGEALDRAVWEHVRGLLGDPQRLLAQFQDFTLAAEQEAAREAAAEHKLRARLDSLARADQRLLDAYQAEVISLEELTERRGRVAEQRHALDRHLETARTLRQSRIKAQAVATDLAAFCTRLHSRLDEASFTDKQAILQLVIERIIVHEDRLEIRHVIPLRDPEPGRPDTSAGNGRLRSDGVHTASLPSRAEHAGDRQAQAVVGIRDDQLDPLQAALCEALQKARPERLGFRGTEAEADDLAPALGIDGDSDYRRHRDDSATLAHLQGGGVEPEIRPFPRDRPVEKAADALVDLLAQLGDLAFRDAGQPHRLHQLINAAGRDAADPGFLDHRDQRLLGRLARLQKGREVRTLAQLGDAQAERSQSGIEAALAVAVPVVEPLGAAFVPPRADQPFDIGFHQDLQHGLRHGPEKIAITALLQQLDKRHSVVGHRVLGRVGGGSQFHLSAPSR